MPGPGRDEGIALADLLAAFSLATDLGLGQPMEHVLRSWRIATRLSDVIDLDEDERASLYYIAALAWVGCVADTPELAKWFGDDIAFRGDSYEVELAVISGARIHAPSRRGRRPEAAQAPAGLHPRRHPRQGHRARVPRTA